MYCMQSTLFLYLLKELKIKQCLKPHHIENDEPYQNLEFIKPVVPIVNKRTKENKLTSIKYKPITTYQHRNQQPNRYNFEKKI